MSLAQVLSRIDAQIPFYVDQLKRFVRIPSISAGGSAETVAALDRAADFLIDDFQRLDLQAQKIRVCPETPPLVLAHSAGHPSRRPTVLIYGHYDVQGVDNPRSAWRFDPFAAAEEDGYLIGRGASDDKGQLFAYLKAVEAILAVARTLPIEVVFLIEGEEESGSRALAQFVASGRLDEFGPFQCTLVSDTSMFGPDQPSLTLGLRGIVFTHVAVHGPPRDLHSGLFGGLVCNPNHLLARALAALTTPEGRVLIPGFYDDVREPSSRERALYRGLEDSASLPPDLELLAGEEGYSLLERRWLRPTLDIHYLSGGSPRTVIPAQATAALSCRLVPDQDPLRIEAALQDFIRAQLPAGIRVEFGPTHTALPYSLDVDHPLVEPALRALRIGFQCEPVLIREGGTIPAVVDLASRTKAPVLLLGFGQLTDNWHGPNERFSLRDFHRGVRTAAALLYELGQR